MVKAEGRLAGRRGHVREEGQAGEALEAAGGRPGSGRVVAGGGGGRAVGGDQAQASGGERIVGRKVLEVATLVCAPCIHVS